MGHVSAVEIGMCLFWLAILLAALMGGGLLVAVAFILIRELDWD